MQAMMECCNTAPSACPALKKANPGVFQGDGSSTYPDNQVPNFCHLHGNLCTKCVYCYLNWLSQLALTVAVADMQPCSSSCNMPEPRLDLCTR